MYKFTGYAIRTPDGNIQPQLIPTKAKAITVCSQNGLDESCIIQLFRWEKFSPQIQQEEVKEVSKE